MTIEHHPTDEVLLAYASGQLDESSSLLVATHLALCPRCRRIAAQDEALGGAFLEDLAPAEMSDSAMTSVMGRIAREPNMADVVSRPGPQRSDRPEDTLYPEPLRSYLLEGTASAKWRKLGFGVEYLPIETSSDCKVGLMKIAPGTAMPIHGHKGSEMTMVLSGGYSDDFGRFARGDVEMADKHTVHQPVTDPDEPCICLVATDAPISLQGGIVNRLMQHFLPF